MATVRIVRQSHKSLFIRLHSYPEFSIGNIIEISICKESRSFTFIRKIIQYHKSYGIGIPDFFAKKFGLNLGDIVEITNIDKLVPIKRSPLEMFSNNKVDLLSLIPSTTRKNKRIYVSIFQKNNEEWLRIWALGIKIQLELRRYLDIEILGNLLGQIQAEGPKFHNNRTPHVAFSNILIKEHKDFIDALRHLGISDDLFYVQCRYDHVKKEDVELAVMKFTELTGVDINGYLTKRKKGIEFDTYVMSSILAEILLNSMNVTRRLYMLDFNQNIKLLAESFIVKLLNGDGTIIVTKVRRIYRKNVREGYNIQGRIGDKNSEYRKDYVQILGKLGFNSRDDDVNLVYFSCRLNDLLYLFKIGAFKGTGNWNKILYSIKLLTHGKTSRGKSLLRLTELPTYPFKLRSLKLGIGYPSLRSWVWNMRKEGYIKENKGILEIAPHVLDIAKTLEDVNKESKILNIS